ncbi:hypothetical protein CPB84DRAFT_1761548, partial [Gymnopilus junonius]
MAMPRAQRRELFHLQMTVACVWSTMFTPPPILSPACIGMTMMTTMNTTKCSGSCPGRILPIWTPSSAPLSLTPPLEQEIHPSPAHANTDDVANGNYAEIDRGFHEAEDASASSPMSL